jgi:hypothetical protein
MITHATLLTFLRQGDDNAQAAADFAEQFPEDARTLKALLILTSAVRVLAQYLYERRRERAVNPDGRFDSAGRWYPSESENADGFTARVRSPSRHWPYSYLLAARRRIHVAALLELNLLGATIPDDLIRTTDQLGILRSCVAAAILTEKPRRAKKEITNVR